MEGEGKVEEYLRMKKELTTHEKTVAEKVGKELILKCAGKSTYTLREATLEYIYQNQLSDDMSLKLKSEIDRFISNLKIPAQEN